MKDRLIQYPNRYRLVAVQGQEGVYDLEAVTGTVTEQGTPLNKANLLTDATANANYLTDDRAVVNTLLRGFSPMGVASYLAFVGGVSGDQLDASFGKNNEGSISGLGLALAMYAKFKDPTIDIATTFPNLIRCNTLDEIVNGGGYSGGISE